ncbi:uncharacterized protein LOC106874738 [Octopus bimaculoides]|uniref:Uncharacterized protein n=1 Tax=Octopus bimaculoides TaxID=37653 RepID=A0A0L8GU44_OCTBM|nr:uncharacterized protein LOC106874738 [Octopus bimaculoides]|eukprot:XP_014778059.1 PREDICTED: uncharacterized protein LOC106874738 [Octopus bimaculoides]
MTRIKYQRLGPSLDNTHAGHVTARLQDILLLILLLLVTFSGHSVSAEYDDTKGCQVKIQKASSSENQPFEAQATRGYVINSLKVIKQISSQECVPNVMYGYTLTSWWVKKGCVAKFKIEECDIADCVIRTRSGSNPYFVLTYHPATPGFRIKLVSLWQQTSYHPCRPGSTLFYNETMWWLDKGCEGRFQILECPLLPIDYALTPTEAPGGSLEVNENHKSNRKHFKFDADTITPGYYPSERRKTVQGRSGNDRKQHTHEVEASGNVHPLTMEKSDTTTASRHEANSSPALLITTLLLVVALGIHTLL